MVWYVSKHQHKENLGTFGSGLERLEAFWNRLDAFRALWDLMRVFGMLEAGQHNPICMYGM